MNFRIGTVIAAGAIAFMLSMPAETTADFATGGSNPTCNSRGRTDTPCRSIGSPDCTVTYKTCYTNGYLSYNSYCTDGTGTAATGCGPPSTVCGAENHATDSSVCTPP